MEIRCLNGKNITDIGRWSRYVADHPESTFYHRIEWKNVIEKSFGHKTYYLMAIDGERVTGILPMAHIRSILFGSMFCSMPFLNFGGICSDNKEAEQLLLEEAIGILKRQNGDYLELRQFKRSSTDIPVKTHKVSMTLELNPDPEILWNKFSPKQRQTIRKAAKNGLEFRFGRGELIGDFYDVLCRGWRDLGTPIYQFSFFENVLNTFGDSIEIYLVTYNGKPIASALVGLFKKTVEGMWLANLKDFAKLQTNYFQYWKMIERACTEGYDLFHFGRSTAESGGQFFKEKWNAVPQALYWEYILNRVRGVPELNVQNKKFSLPIKVWRKLPIQITKILGPRIARSIP